MVNQYFMSETQGRYDLHMKTVMVFRAGNPRMCHFGMWMISGRRISRPKRLKKSFYLSLNFWKNLDRSGASTRKKAITVYNRLICIA